MQACSLTGSGVKDLVSAVTVGPPASIPILDPVFPWMGKP